MALIELATVEETKAVAEKVTEILQKKESENTKMIAEGNEGSISHSILLEEIEDCKFLLEAKPEVLPDFVYNASRVASSTTCGDIYDAVKIISNKGYEL